ncbi:MAG: GTPase HflX [Bacteroidia bacterium]|nr:GTPase HflX [Bacteroidia bacterium]
MKKVSYQVKTEKTLETAVLIAVEVQTQSREETDDFLTELEFLTTTAGARVLKRFVQRLEMPNPKTYVGSGKLQEVADFIERKEINTAIFDDELSPSQIRNLEKELKCKIIDRSTLILDIFAKNAKTNRAKTQVELAQSEYLLPRLTRMWTHLEKQRGGIGMKGPGEKEIETDRRIIRDKISLLKKKLEHIDKQGVTQRKNRSGELRLALVGYTNVGKSTIMNALTDAKILAENKLFATLDSTVRKLVLTRDAEVYVPPIITLISDTVGFIRKLPHQLVESFKSTLDEIKEADILLHVVDISHPTFESQMEIVNETLSEIGAVDKKVLTVFNKIDSYNPRPTSDDIFEDETLHDLDDFMNSWYANENLPAIFISAKNKDDINTLREKLFDLCSEVQNHKY